MQPLDQEVAGRQSNETVTWTDALLESFHSAQSAPKSCKVVTLPRPSDTLWIVTDGAVKEGSMEDTLYILRHDQLLLAGFFSARLCKHQVTWLPCEVEALSIATAVNHFAPYIIQAAERTHVLTDSMPCVLAYNKLRQGEFSNSARFTSFQSTASRYQVVVGHIVGSANLPSDYASRNPVACQDSNCQVCSFVSDLETSVVRTLSVTDVTDGAVSMPFTNRPAWVDTQRDCPDLRRVHAHLKQGTGPQRIATSIPDVKRYLKVATIAPDGLLVVKETSPFHRCIDRIIIPKQVLLGLLTALHIKFSHPSAYQLKRLVSRYFFAINLDKAIEQITTSCSQCTDLCCLQRVEESNHIHTPSMCRDLLFPWCLLSLQTMCRCTTGNWYIIHIYHDGQAWDQWWAVWRNPAIVCWH